MIPESQLETWSHQGAIATAKATHESIRLALEGDDALSEKDFEIYLQGSYKNDTNIRGDSDVDVVVQLNTTFNPGTSGLTPAEVESLNRDYPNATYRWLEFRADVLNALRDYYDDWNAVSEGNKVLKLVAGSGRLPADIVVALLHRKYRRYPGVSVDGTWFRTMRDNRAVVNFPKQHYESGVAKNSKDDGTGGWYKPTVRMFKNARNRLIDAGKIPEDLAPSYFLECLLYNAPDHTFGPDFQTTYLDVIDSLLDLDFDALMCQNGELSLFGPSPEQWSAQSAVGLLKAYLDLWENW